jgi:hypothetical protein
MRAGRVRLEHATRDASVEAFRTAYEREIA